MRNRISFNSPNSKAGPAPRGAFRGRARPNHCLCFPNKNCAAPPSEDCAPKKLTGSVLLECCSTPETPRNTGCHPRIREQELFFRRFCNKHGLFWWLYPRTHENSRMFGDEDFFFGLTSEFVEIRSSFKMKTRIQDVFFFF